MSFFPFYFPHILTNDGLEFTNKLIKSKKGNICTKDSLLDVKYKENNILHRFTKPAPPKTTAWWKDQRATSITTHVDPQVHHRPRNERRPLHFLAQYLLYRKHSGLLKK